MPLMAGGAAPRAAHGLHPADSPRHLESPPSRRVRGRPWPLGGAGGSRTDPSIMSRDSPAGRGRCVESAERSAQAPSPPPRPVGTKGARPRRAGKSGGPGGADRGARGCPGWPRPLSGSPVGLGRALGPGTGAVGPRDPHPPGGHLGPAQAVLDLPEPVPCASREHVVSRGSEGGRSCRGVI